MKITFIPFFENAGATDNLPTPAANQIPSWFKTMPQFMNNDKKLKLNNGSVNSTIKWCNPFLDGFITGYIVRLEQDLLVSRVDGIQFIDWRPTGQNVVTEHYKEQIPAELVPDNYNPLPFKFQNKWGIKTPNGYAALFTHPLNRTDLPFITLSGVVDTDNFTIPVSFPFLLKNDFEGIIEAGTPIAQIIPIKKESWVHEFLKFDFAAINNKQTKFLSKIYRSYKQQYWTKKEYK